MVRNYIYELAAVIFCVLSWSDKCDVNTLSGSGEFMHELIFLPNSSAVAATIF